MACRNSVASEEFADFIAPYFTSPENFMRSQGTDCIDFVNSTLAVVYIPFSTITSFSYTSYTYSAIPKLYSLLDVTSMDAAGITAAGELPVLNNQGEGVLIVLSSGADSDHCLHPDRRRERREPVYLHAL